VARADGKLSGRVIDLSDHPVSGASVVIKSPEGSEVRVVTDPTGRYAATVAHGGAYTVTFVLGTMQSAERIDIPDDGAATLDGQLEIGGEVIEVHGVHRPLRYPKVKSDPLAIPPYSDEATLGNYWTKAWLLLDVDDHGVVRRVKFLKRPGHGLDDIAVKHALGLLFDPARDKNGVPTRSYVVWPLEWPAAEWLQSRELTMNRLPAFPASKQLGRGLMIDMMPACAEGRGLNLGMIHPTQRDCSVPDLSRADASELWLTRDSGVPVPFVEAAPVINPVKEREDLIASSRRSRTYAIVSTAVTGAAAVGTLVSYWRYSDYSDRVEADMANHRGPGQLAADKDVMHRWELGMIGFLVGTLVSGYTTGYLWSHTSSLSLQATPRGGGVSLAGRF
jgi:hypothetical protein